MTSNTDSRQGACLSEPQVIDGPPRYLVVWAGPVPDRFSMNAFDHNAFDLAETVKRISVIYAFEFERVELQVLRIVDWCSNSMRRRKTRTLFEFARFTKGELVPPKLAHDRLLHAQTFWMALTASELLMPTGGFVDDYKWSDSYNEMVDDPDDLALEWERVWREVKYAKGEDLLKKCFEEARSLDRRFHSSPTYNSFLCLALCLQRARGEEPIRLPQARLAELLGCSQQDVSNLTKRAMKDGYIKRVSDARYAHRLAAKYVFRKLR